ncbi:hypothetical protein IM40_01610 [Candidatus Paracaedimonas acanthamoebae]|nr:hypothetical protein IM40_01610 [Candidatus Paracaedimonas acanthamoebae]
MKKYALIAGLLMVQAPFAYHAEAAVSGKDIAKLISGAAGSKFCEKASFFSGKFTVRSLNGEFCNHRDIAAIALKKCSGKSDFDSSQCAKNAKKAIGGKTVEQAVKEAVADPQMEKLAEEVGVAE